MPELPEVELARITFDRAAVSRRVVAVSVRAGAPLRVAPNTLRRGLVGAAILATHRRGKQLAIELCDGRGSRRALLVHLGMSGHVVAGAPPEARLTLRLDDGSAVALTDTRRLGRVELARWPSSADPWAILMPELGPDALDLARDPAALESRFRGARTPVKVALLDQARLAGVGNIYAVEALHFAELDPRVPASRLTRADWARVGEGLARAMEQTLDEARRDPEFRYLSEGGDNRFRVYGREDSPCHRCHTDVRRLVQAGRSTYWCPGCQRSPLVTGGRAEARPTGSDERPRSKDSPGSPRRARAARGLPQRGRRHHRR